MKIRNSVSGPYLGSLQIFELPTPFDVIARRKFDLLAHCPLGIADISAEIATLHVDVNIVHQLRIFGADRGPSGMAVPSLVFTRTWLAMACGSSRRPLGY